MVKVGIVTRSFERIDVKYAFNLASAVILYLCRCLDSIPILKSHTNLISGTNLEIVAFAHEFF